MVYLPIIGAFLEAAGMILEKKVLRHRKVDYRNYTAYGFLAIVLVMSPFLYFFWRLDAGAFSQGALGLFALVVVASVLANLLIFYSLKRENLTEFEPIWLMQPFFTILLAFILYPAERNWVVVGLALVASITLVVSHIEKHHLKLDRYVLAALAGGFLFSVELVASRPILEYYSGFTLYFVRCLFICAIAFMMYRPGARFLKNKSVAWMTVAIGVMWVVYRLIIYQGYMTLGIVFTTVLFILSPVLIFLFAVIFLKEKPTVKQIVSTAIILICVALAVVLNR